MRSPPTGDAAALRLPHGTARVAREASPSAFAAEQWLRADADARAARRREGRRPCDDLGCVARARRRARFALVTARGAFIEDCARAAIVVTPLRAPRGLRGAASSSIAASSRKPAPSCCVFETARSNGSPRAPRRKTGPGRARPPQTGASAPLARGTAEMDEGSQTNEPIEPLE